MRSPEDDLAPSPEAAAAGLASPGSEPFVVSVHIPKTAGTTLAHVFDRVFNRRVIYDYDGYRNPIHATAPFKTHADFIASHFAVIHGHFFARKYFAVFPEAAFVSILRHPVERIISQYLHELNESSSDAWYHGEIVSGRMDIVAFAEQAGIGDAMARHLAGRSVADYDLLMIAEDMHKSLHVFSRKIRPLRLEHYFGQSLPRENQRGRRAKTVRFDKRTRTAIFARSTQDNEIYREAAGAMSKWSRIYLS